ncbi:MAG TPA: DUF6055 domain-containing protein [Anaerolineales bacterium]|nr:DUF6055 domain-containing protein [Anaerolineales bacterium]
MNKRFFLLAIILFTLLACSTTQPREIIPTDTEPTQALVSPTPMPSAYPSPTSAPTETPLPTFTPLPPTATPDPITQIGEFYLVTEKPIILSDYLALLDAKVTAGEWTYEQGLITLLKTLTGEEDDLPKTGDLLTDEVGPVFYAAQDYLLQGTDPAAKAEISRLLARWLPAPENMLPYARPQPNSSRLSPQVRAKSTYQDSECEELWAAGFPPGGSTPCVLYTEAQLTSGTGRVFYPVSFDEKNLVNVLNATEAMVQADEVYAGLGSTHSIDMVFTLLNSMKGELASVPVQESPNCLILVTPAGVASATAHSVDYFKQVIAHEVFHCFQQWNFLAATPGNFGANRWWLEGSAEYFSNVVYPTANREWDFVPSFNLFSSEKALYEMDYANAVFFQYLGNELGNPALVGLFKSIPASPDPMASVGVFSAYPEMQTIFHHFGEAWADQAIVDSGGVILPTRVILSSGDSHNVTEFARVNMNTKPFTLARSLIHYSKGYLYQITALAEGSEGLESTRPDGIPHAWGDLSGTIPAGCGDPVFLYLSTSTDPTPTPRKVEIDISGEENHECDQCLVGTWQLDAQKFAEDFVASMYRDASFKMQVDSVSGGLTLKFYANGIYLGAFEHLLVSLSDAATGIHTTFQHTGQSYGTYQTDGKSLTVDNLLSTVVMQISVGSQTGEPRPQEGVGFGVGKGLAYTCNGDTLTFTATDGSTGQPIEVQYTRLSSK